MKRVKGAKGRLWNRDVVILERLKLYQTMVLGLFEIFTKHLETFVHMGEETFKKTFVVKCFRGNASFKIGRGC